MQRLGRNEEIRMTKELENETELEEKKEEETKSFTQEEVDKLLQSNGDKRVSSALETAQAKWEAEYTSKLETERSEAEKLAKMSEEERYKAELNKQREEFEAEKQQFQKERLENQTIKELSANNLPVDFANYLLADSAEDIKTNIDTFKNQWVNAIEAAVNERLKGNTPNGSNVAGSTMTKKEFGLLNIHDRNKMFKENPDAVKQILTGK